MSFPQSPVEGETFVSPVGVGYIFLNGGWVTRAKLDRLFDVDVNTNILADGQVLAYSSSSEIWKPSTLGEAAGEATIAEYWAAAAGKFIAPAMVWASAAETALAMPTGDTLTIDFNNGYNFHLTLTGNITLGNPAHIKNQAGHIRILQDGTGGRTLTFGAYWKTAGGSAPSLSTTPGAMDVIYYKVLTSTIIEYTLSKGVA